MSESHASHAPRFIHLRLHTEYSISDGIVQVDAAIARAAADGMPALGISDLANLFGMVKFYKGARGKGIKPVIGADCWITNPVDRDKPSRVLLICKSRKGYGQLCELLTRAFMENKYRGRAEIVRDWLSAETASDLLCLSGARDGDIGHALANGNTQLAETFAADWARRFPDGFYIELQRAGHPGTESYIRDAVQLAARLDLPVVATHPIQFTRPEDFKAHEARVCIAQGHVLADKRRPKDFTPEQYFKTQDEMCALFADIPEALENSVEIARRCSLTVQLGKNFLPDFPIPPGMTIDEYLVEEVLSTLDDEVTTFLLESAVVPRFSAELLNSLLQRQDSAAMLEALSRSGNLFLTALDTEGVWYRYHPLFRELLLDRLRTEAPVRFRAIASRAAELSAAAGDIDGAVLHALAAGDRPTAAALVGRDAVRLGFDGRAGVLARRIALLDERTVAEFPDAAIACAWLGVVTGDAELIQRSLLQAATAVGEGDLVDDEATGARIVLRAIEEPLRHIAENAGYEGSVVIADVRKAKKGFGLNAATGEIVDLVADGVIDPAMVTRSALQNAASIAKNILTTEAIIAEIPEKDGGGGMPGGMPDMGGMM